MRSARQLHDRPSIDRTLLERASLESTRLLEANLFARGISAARRNAAADARSYNQIFGRDAAICALAMSGSRVDSLEQGAVASLDSLAVGQAMNGQIPKHVDTDSNHADFWYVGCIDATLWWLIAVDHVRRSGSVPGVASRWQANDSTWVNPCSRTYSASGGAMSR